MSAVNYVIIIIAAALLSGGICIRELKSKRSKQLSMLLSRLSFVLAALLVLKVIIFPDLNSIETTGKYSYASMTFQLEDTTRTEPYTNDGSARKLSAVAYYPNNESIARNSCPLVVFSHGGISYKDSNLSLFKELASHGYVVVSIDHTYQSLFTTIDGRRIWIDRRYMKELQTEDPNKDIAGSFEYYKKWMSIRTADIRFVIDSILAQTKANTKGMYSLIDVNRIATIGHSLGGSAALGVARERSDIKAAVALESPYFCDITGYDDAGFTWDTSPYSCAMLNIYSDNGWPLIASDIRYAQNKRFLINEGTVQYCYIKGSNHYSLTDLVRKSPVFCSILGGGYSTSGKASLIAVNEACLAFLDKYLGGA